MNLGENIYRLRTARNMSQGDLADALDVSRQSVSKWENNSAVPELEKLICMSELFGITLDELVGRDAPTPPPQPAASEAAPPAQTPPYRVSGTILLCFDLSMTLLLSILWGFIPGVMAGLPFTIVGCVLISSTEGFVFKCAWALFAVYAPLVYYVMLNFIGVGYLIRWGILLVWFAVLAIVSIVLCRKGKLSIESRKLMFGSIIAAFIFMILLEIACQILYRRTDLNTMSLMIDYFS